MRSIQNLEIGLKPTPNILIITDETVHTCNDKHISWLEISPDSWPVIYIYIYIIMIIEPEVKNPNVASQNPLFIALVQIISFNIVNIPGT